MTLEELKSQRAELNRQIRALQGKQVSAQTENFQVVRESKKKLCLSYCQRFGTTMRPHLIFCIRPWGDEKAEDLPDKLCEEIDGLISQLESIKEQIKK